MSMKNLLSIWKGRRVYMATKIKDEDEVRCSFNYEDNDQEAFCIRVSNDCLVNSPLPEIEDYI